METLERSFNKRERRGHPRFIIDLPLEYRDTDGSCLRGGVLANASEGGFLIEAVRDVPVGTELNIAVLFPKGFELSNFNVVAKIVRKEPYSKEDLKGDPVLERIPVWIRIYSDIGGGPLETEFPSGWPI